VHARAAELDHARAQRAQPGQIELGVAVQPADPTRRGGRQHAVGADHRAGFAVVGGRAHQQVLAERVEHVDVVPRRRALRHAQPSAHFFDEDEVPQALRLANVFFIASPNHIQPSLLDRTDRRECFAPMK